jgi:hypothetical protein
VQRSSTEKADGTGRSCCRLPPPPAYQLDGLRVEACAVRLVRPGRAPPVPAVAEESSSSTGRAAEPMPVPTAGASANGWTEARTRRRRPGRPRSVRTRRTPLKGSYRALVLRSVGAKDYSPTMVRLRLPGR